MRESIRIHPNLLVQCFVDVQSQVFFWISFLLTHRPSCWRLHLEVFFRRVFYCRQPSKYEGRPYELLHTSTCLIVTTRVLSSTCLHCDCCHKIMAVSCSPENNNLYDLIENWIVKKRQKAQKQHHTVTRLWNRLWIFEIEFIHLHDIKNNSLWTHHDNDQACTLSFEHRQQTPANSKIKKIHRKQKTSKKGESHRLDCQKLFTHLKKSFINLLLLIYS